MPTPISRHGSPPTPSRRPPAAFSSLRHRLILLQGTGPEQVFLSGLRSKQGVQQSVRRRSSSPMNGVLAAIRPRCDAAGSNSVACFGGGSNSKQPQGSPLDPACQLPTGNARGDVFAVSLSPISHLHPTRFDLANPFDVTALSIAQSCLARVVCLSGQDGPMACEGFRRPSNEQPQPCTGRANSPGRSSSSPLETTPRNEAPVEAACPNGMA